MVAFDILIIVDLICLLRNNVNKKYNNFRFILPTHHCVMKSALMEVICVVRFTKSVILTPLSALATGSMTMAS